LKSLIQSCGNKYPTNFVVETHGKWYEYCSPGGWAIHHHVYQDVCKPRAAFLGVLRTNKLPKAEYIETRYRLEAQHLTNITTDLDITTLFVERSLNTPKALLKERRKYFLDIKNSNYIVLHADKQASIGHGLIQGHQSNAFAISDASAIFHTIIINRPFQNVSIVPALCNELHFKSDVCFPAGSTKKNWVQYYWEYCTTDATACRDNLGLVKDADTLLTSSSQSSSLLIYGISDSFRKVLVVASLLTIIAFIAFENKTRQTVSMPGIGVLRFIASIHIVAGHLQRFGRAYMTPIPFVEFGYTWVPWFMMLSAFVLSTSTLNKNTKIAQLPWHKFLYIRIKGIYPVYIAGLFATVLSSKRHVSIRRYMIDIVLAQAWYPGWTEGAIMPHSWFLSAIVPCWALHNYLFKMIERLSTRKLITVCTFITVVPYLSFAFTKCWWCDHSSNHYDTLVDVLVVMLKFHPICYLPLYVSGICIAHLLHRWKSSTTVPQSNASVIDTEEKVKMTTCQSDSDTEEDIFINSLQRTYCLDYLLLYGCSLGATGLLSSFMLARLYHFQGAKLAFRLGCLLPWHALLLMGIAVGSPNDPVRKLFEIQLLQIFGNISYCQYIFQFIWFHKWSGYISFSFWPFCVAFSIVAHIVFERQLKQKKWVQTCIGLSLLFFLIYLLGASQFNVGFDSNIQISSSENDTLRWINPSIAWSKNSTLLMSARRLQLEVPDTHMGSIWSSDIGIGELKIHGDKFYLRRDEHPKSFLKIIEQVPDTVSCHTPSLWVRGFEDPRISIVNESIYLSAVHHAQNDDACFATPALLKLTDDWYLSSYHRLIKSPLQSTKNWMHLKDHLYMTNIETSSVVKVDPQSGNITEISSREPVSWLKNMHGGSNFVESSSVIDGENIWLGVIHSAGSYHNYLIEFEFDAPYLPRRLSKQIPLYAPKIQDGKNTSSISTKVAFASGLAPCDPLLSINECMIITYGSNDVESRAFVIRKAGIENLFLKRTVIRKEN
jgi:peptidoglycan/LPS O-acetylase OafA/YrhL